MQIVYICTKNIILRNMKKNIIIMGLLFMTLKGFAQADSTTFKGHLYNNEYEVYIDMNFYKNDILVPHQEIFGKIAGFLGDIHDGRKWLFTSAKIVNKKNAQIEIINDYGSEDLEATLTCNPDGTYTLTQGKGSTIKIVRNRKWVKIPKILVFKKTR